MTQVPEGAQRSEDGHYWWDEANNQWQPIEGGGAAAAAGGAAAGAAAGAAGGAGGGAAEGDERAQARVQAGLPAEKHAASDDQKAPYLAEAVADAYVEGASEVEVPEIQHEETA